jgi:general secretion pathway protein J
MKPARLPMTLSGAPGRRGFTLVEVLVALVVMAVLAGLAWRGLDGIVRSREISNEALDRALRLNTIVAQWEQDLLAVQDTGAVPALSFDGQTLRLTRRVDGGVALVAWAVRGGSWQRWVAPVATRVSELGEHWLRSQQLLGNEPGQLTLAEATDWQVYFYRGNAWTNAQSTGDFAGPGNLVPPPVAPPGNAQGGIDQFGQRVQPEQGQQGEQGGQDKPEGQGGEGGQTPDPATEAANAAAAAAAAAAGQRELLPGAVRLVITLREGPLTRDIALGPGG